MGGHMKVAKLMIKKGADDWDDGLFEACYGGYMKIVKLMIKNGANDFNQGLKAACYGGHKDIAPTVLWIMGIPKPEEMTGISLIEKYK